PSTLTLVILGLACLLGARCLYGISLRAHAQYGELFKSVFDQYRSKVIFDDVVKTVGGIMDDPTLSHRLRNRERYRVVLRYLQYGRIRDESTHVNKTVGEWKKP